MKNISKAYPGVKALKNVDFNLEAGEIHCLLGENGAGKSTLIKILAGAEDCDTGEIEIQGSTLDINSPILAKKMGICTVYQEFTLIPQLTVAENIYLGIDLKKNGLVDWNQMFINAEAVLETLGFHIDARISVCNLSVHEQQVVEIAKALALDAKILILDEPTAALTNIETKRLFELLAKLRSKDVGIIYISHNLEDVKLIGDRATILKDGQKVASVDLKDILVENLPKLMVGEEVEDQFPKSDVKLGKNLLTVKNCSDPNGRFHDVSFELSAGEVVSFAGLLGSGTEPFVRSLVGLMEKPAGEISISGKGYIPSQPHAAIQNGIFYLPADRKSEGLVLSMSVLDNATLANLKRYITGGLFSHEKQLSDCEAYQRQLGIKTPSLHTLSRFLSGGNQQKTMIARCLNADAKVIIFNEPSRGVDVRARVEIYRLINNLVADGAAVIIISHEVSEIIGVSDRIFIWKEGRISETLDRSEATKEKVLKLITQS